MAREVRKPMKSNFIKHRPYLARLFAPRVVSSNQRSTATLLSPDIARSENPSQSTVPRFLHLFAKRLLAGLLSVLLLPAIASADVTPKDANLAKYQEQYGEASAEYKRLRYGAEDGAIVGIKEALATLGYFPHRASANYYRTLEIAMRVFYQQMRIGGDGTEITPLAQAMLVDAASLPEAISPVIDVGPYSWDPDSGNYTAYTYARVSRSGVASGTSVGFAGQITATARDGAKYYCAVQMEGDPAKVVYVAYQPLPRTTVFQAGDSVAVFGVTQGQQSLPYEAMSATALLVSADRVGYAAK